LDKQIEVDWEKWERKEWPKWPLLAIPVIAGLALALGALVNKPLVATALGLAAGFGGSVLISRFRRRD